MTYLLTSHHPSLEPAPCPAQAPTINKIWWRRGLLAFAWLLPAGLGILFALLGWTDRGSSAYLVLISAFVSPIVDNAAMVRLPRGDRIWEPNEPPNKSCISNRWLSTWLVMPIAAAARAFVALFAQETVVSRQDCVADGSWALWQWIVGLFPVLAVVVFFLVSLSSRQLLGPAWEPVARIRAHERRRAGLEPEQGRGRKQ